MTTQQTRPLHSSATFHTTRWTRVCLAKADSEDGRRALADLCDAYYEPVVAFLRAELRDADAARDLSHAFFAQMLAGGTIHTADRERGRFRSYLLGAVKHYLSHHRTASRREKRGGGMEAVPIDDESVRSLPDASQMSPDAAFDRQWALTLLTRALDALRQECTSEGRVSFFDQMKPWLMGEGAHGDQAAVAASCGMSTAALKMSLHRLKKRFRQCVKTEVTGTLDDPAMVESEMQSLFAALGG
ncbi:RNA polymerase subunit sigma-24 [Verrucomicrobiaceae bacterium SCGC AG-212-N21]|nr:RNA polymerase subunit sigma-24 [Verrucomicrobiaceae bacterium SCGC AG-212-N21]